MTRNPDPDLDLTIARVIKAPRHAVWKAWTDAKSLEQWWVPAPAKCKVRKLEIRPGGVFVTDISEGGGDFTPHVSFCVLCVDEGKELVLTDALLGGWRPATEGFMTAVITLADHPEGTAYSALVMHRNGADRAKHVELGFYDGWGTVTEQLAKLVEAPAK